MAASSGDYPTEEPKNPTNPELYDLIVIGGGSGGIAAAREAASLGKKVCLLNWVDASPYGSVYQLGGTCVNVGCIPKKLMHYAGLLHGHINDAREFGWKVPQHADLTHQWETLVDLVQDYIGKLTIAYVTEFRSEESSVKYYRAKGYFVDATTVHAHNNAPGRQKVNLLVRAPHIIIAVGGRPDYLNVPGARELCITSDDIFSLRGKQPGKTLVVGASYIALECAGFLAELGFPVTIAVRSIFLRDFDQQIAEKIGAHLEETGVRIWRPAEPTSFHKIEDSGRILVKYSITIDGIKQEKEEEFDTVLLAIGRHHVTRQLRLEAAGIEAMPDGSIACDEYQRSNVPSVYVIGDNLHRGPQLTPVAIKTGRLLVQRLFAGSKTLMDFRFVPTTVFTPLEYGTIGESEESAERKYGADQIEIYHSAFEPLEFAALIDSKRPKYSGYVKLVCLIPENLRVVGFHYLGPNAGEVTQGFATAMILGATKEQFDATIGIHPTCAEQLTTLKITKRSGISLETTGCAT